MRIFSLLASIALGAAGWTTPAVATTLPDRIFENGFEPCCTVGGGISGLVGNGLVLHFAAGSIAEEKPVAPNGGLYVLLYQFTHTVPTGTQYTVSVGTQPLGQTCSMSNASAAMGSTAATNVNASCANGLIWDQGQWDHGSWN